MLAGPLERSTQNSAGGGKAPIESALYVMQWIGRLAVTNQMGKASKIA